MTQEKKRGPGRPPKSDAPMKLSITLRLSAEEHALMKQCRDRLAAESLAKGDARGWSLADVVRRAIRQTCRA